MNITPLCIKIDNKIIAELIWDLLKTKGYTESGTSVYINDFNYIWVNGYFNNGDRAGYMCYAWYDRPVEVNPGLQEFNAATQLGDLIEKLNEEPLPPTVIRTDDYDVFSDGSVTIGHYPNTTCFSGKDFDALIRTRSNLLKEWKDYVKMRGTK